MNYKKLETISIRNHPQLDEKWIQARIAEDPSILGLGDDLILKDQERLQPRAGRLDLLFQEAEENKRYEVEIQLGATDESHIIRTIEYWDIERRRYPQYEHSAVIVAEDITSRFLNVISLFNGMIPLIAIQMKAIKVGDEIGLVFTKIVDQMPLGLVDEDEEAQEVTDRAYWEQRGSKQTVAIADELLAIARQYEKNITLNYTKFYIGLAKENRPNNFVIFRPKKMFLKLEPRLRNTAEAHEILSKSGLDVMDYDNRWGRFRIRLRAGDVEKNKSLLTEIIAMAYKESFKD